MKVAIDSSVLVGLINPLDVWRAQALLLRDTLLATDTELLYFDCVAAEAISAAARRLHEKGRSTDVEALLARLNAQVPVETITWILPDVPRLYSAALELIRSSSGALNFNDALGRSRRFSAPRRTEVRTTNSFTTHFEHTLIIFAVPAQVAATLR